MKLINVGLVILVSVVLNIQSERTHSGVCTGCPPSAGYTRVKRAKYYSSPPLRFYRRPTFIYPIKGPFSYTPPPGYMMDDDMPPSYLRPKVSERPTNEGLGDGNINNIAKFISQQELDKVIEFANEKGKELQKYDKEYLYDRLNDITTREKYDSSKAYNLEFDNEQKFSLSGPFISTHGDLRHDVDYNTPNQNDLQETNLFINAGQGSTGSFIDTNKMQSQQHLNINPYVQEVNDNFKRNRANIFTDSSIMQEEQLPKPSNLREDDYEASYTNNIPTVVKAESNAYKVENLGELPLMNYHSKPDTVDSYKVPHYTVTSDGDYGAPASKATIPVEPAPPVSTAKEQSDAHLKAIKIWTHKSKGTAYTLHDDGTLSREWPSRPKNNYGHP